MKKISLGLTVLSFALFASEKSSAALIGSFSGSANLQPCLACQPGTYVLSCPSDGSCVDFYDDGTCYVYNHGWYNWDIAPGSGGDPKHPTPETVDVTPKQ